MYDLNRPKGPVPNSVDPDENSLKTAANGRPNAYRLSRRATEFWTYDAPITPCVGLEAVA
jgi:hypothetical protein